MPRLALLVPLAGAVLALAACGGEVTVTPTPQTVVGTIQQATVGKGNATAGKAIFAAQGCGSCHTLKQAGTTGTVGPNLNTGLAGKTPDFVRESIVNPNAEITAGFPPNVMPQDYGTKLSTQQLADLIAFITQKSS